MVLDCRDNQPVLIKSFGSTFYDWAIEPYEKQGIPINLFEQYVSLKKGGIFERVVNWRT